MTETWDGVAQGVHALAAEWRATRGERQARRHLEIDDIEALAATGFHRAAAPAEHGGAWVDLPSSTRPLCEILRNLAGADSSVALVSSMHPAVVGFWLAKVDPSRPAWTAQRESVFAGVRDGHRWGTITSEPGSGGDVAKTKAVATPISAADAALAGDTFAVTGDKHFGSGSGVNTFMITTAVAEGADAPMFYALDVRDRPWDGSAGLQLLGEWDGMGMAATQSHAMRLDHCPAVRMAWDGPIEDITLAAGPLISALFTAVVLGVLDEAVRTAKAQLAPRLDGLRAYEKVEWARAEMDHWLAVQAYEGALRTIETGDHLASLHAAIRAKQSVAELAESTLLRLTRVLGGGTYSRRSPFSHWFEDVRALGFLRPPWGLAYDSLVMSSML